MALQGPERDTNRVINGLVEWKSNSQKGEFFYESGINYFI